MQMQGHRPKLEELVTTIATVTCFRQGPPLQYIL